MANQTVTVPNVGASDTVTVVDNRTQGTIAPTVTKSGGVANISLPVGQYTVTVKQAGGLNSTSYRYVVNDTAAGAGGGATAPAERQASIFYMNDPAQVIYAAEPNQLVGPNIAAFSRVDDNEDFIGVPVAQLGMNLQENASNYIPYPAGDATYDVFVYAGFSGGHADDVGKIIYFTVTGGTARETLFGVVDVNGSVELRGSFTDVVFAGLTANLSFQGSTTTMTHPINLTQMIVQVFRR